jgi:hypothetical protein
MIAVIAVVIVLAGQAVGLALRACRRQAVARRHRCPPDRPWAEREWRLRHALQGPGRWIDTEEVGLPPEVVDGLCASAGWRVQAAFRVDARAWMLWVVPPVPPAVAVRPGAAPAARRPVRTVLSRAAGAVVVVAVLLVVHVPGSVPDVLALVTGVAGGVASVVLFQRSDPLQRPRRVLWEELTARFDGDRVTVPVAALPWRYQVDLVPQLATSLGYRAAWGGGSGRLAYRRVRADDAPAAELRVRPPGG